MKVVFQKWITRQDLRDNPDKVYVFGDNLERVGMGGQAREMRGEPNAFGIPTKRKPTMEEDAFFSDESVEDLVAVYQSLSDLDRLAGPDGTVVVPYDGLGTGLSQLPKRAPGIYTVIRMVFDALSGGNCPWERVGPLE